VRSGSAVTVTIRLWSDWSLDPFYIDSGNGSFELTSAEEVSEIFGLPDDVMRQVAAWDRLYQDHLNWDDPGDNPWPSDDYQRHYLDRGRAVARLLRKHLPADVVIEYLADETVCEYY
jgi:cytochrome P450